MKLEKAKYTGNNPKLTGKIGMIKDCSDPSFCLFRPLQSTDWFRVKHQNICDIKHSNNLLTKFNINLLK